MMNALVNSILYAIFTIYTTGKKALWMRSFSSRQLVQKPISFLISLLVMCVTIQQGIWQAATVITWLV